MNSKHDLIQGKLGVYHLCGIAGRGGGDYLQGTRGKYRYRVCAQMSREQLVNRGINALYDELESVQRLNIHL